MKKIFITILFFIICMSEKISYADGFNVIVDNKTASICEIVEISISLENNSGIIAALFNLEYDKERLELIEVQDGQLLEGGTFSPNYKSYPYKLVWNSATTVDFTDNGVLAVLKFKVLETAKYGKAFINISYNENDIFDVYLNNVSIEVINGGIDVVTDTKNNMSTGSGSGSGKYRTSASSEAGSNIVTEKASKQMVLTIGKKEALVFGKIKINDVVPIIRNDRAMIPARFVAENLGADVEWDNDTRKVTITKNDITIIITIDSQTALVNDKVIVLDCPGFIENDRTYTPLRFVAEKLGANVEWNNETQEIYIN